MKRTPLSLVLLGLVGSRGALADVAQGPPLEESLIIGTSATACCCGVAAMVFLVVMVAVQRRLS